MKTKETDSKPCVLHNSVYPPRKMNFYFYPNMSDTVMRDFKEKTLKKKEQMKTPIVE